GDRLQPGGHGLAPPTQLRAHVLETAAGLRQGGGLTGTQVAGEVQRRRLPELGRPDLRPGPPPAPRAAGANLPRRPGQRAVPVRLPALPGHVLVLAADARVLSAHRCPHRPVPPGLAVGAAAVRPAAVRGYRWPGCQPSCPECGPGLVPGRASLAAGAAEAARPDQPAPPAPAAGAPVWPRR